ncbi:MAG TPA: Gfo/Idh/MocA family oxidoreductase [Candidatus Eisenbacteria bacterium]|nr:Gfo/Idh/MocA family oxidoreductase [Candidatus Eisenbacteria bacterium]
MSVRVGVIGVGALGRHHVRTVGRAPGVTLVGAYDPRAERAAFASEHGGQAFADPRALVDSCDALIVASPTRTHREVAGGALEAGRHVLVEKPLAAGAAECDELLALARGGDLVLHVGHVERLNAAVRAARPVIRRPRFIEVRRLAGFTPRGADVDVLLDLMIHDLDLVLEWTGAAPSQVQAVGVAVLTEGEDIANARLEFEDGCVADLTASRVSQEKLRKIRLFQEEAYLSLDLGQGTAEIVEADRHAIAQVVASGALAEAVGGGLPASPPDWGNLVRRRSLPALAGDPLTLQLEAFLAAVRGEEAAGEVRAATGEDGARAVRVAERVREALRLRSERWRR